MKKFNKEAYGYIRDMFVQHNMVKRIVLSFISVILIGFGTSLFSVSGFGVDPFTSMNMNIASTVGISFGTYQLIVNSVILLFVLIFAHRGLIGVGTLLNMVICGYSCQFFAGIISPAVESHYTLALRIPLLIAGIIVLCFACSLFFTVNIGVGPYDTFAFLISRNTKLDFKWARVITDISVVTIGLAFSGGLSSLINGDLSGVKNVGIGTLITAFCMGPVINFFNRFVSSKILNVDYEKLSHKVSFFMYKGLLTEFESAQSSLFNSSTNLFSSFVGK